MQNSDHSSQNDSFCNSFFKSIKQSIITRLWENHQRKLHSSFEQKSSKSIFLHRGDHSSDNNSRSQISQEQIKDQKQLQIEALHTNNQQSFLPIFNDNAEFKQKQILSQNSESCLIPGSDAKSNNIKDDQNSQKYECVSTNVGNAQQIRQNYISSPATINKTAKSQFLQPKKNQHLAAGKDYNSQIQNHKFFNLQRQKQQQQKQPKDNSLPQESQENEEELSPDIVIDLQNNSQDREEGNSSANDEPPTDSEQSISRQQSIHQIFSILQEITVQPDENSSQIIQTQNQRNPILNYLHRLTAQQYLRVTLQVQTIPQESEPDDLVSVEQNQILVQVFQSNSYIISEQIENQWSDQQCNFSNISSIRSLGDKSDFFTNLDQQDFNHSKSQLNQSTFFQSKYDPLNDPISVIVTLNKNHFHPLKNSIKKMICIEWLDTLCWRWNNNFDFGEDTLNIMHIADAKVSESKRLLIVSIYVNIQGWLELEQNKEIIYYYDEETFAPLDEKQLDIDATVCGGKETFDFLKLSQNLHSLDNKKIQPCMGSIIIENSQQLREKYPDQFCDRTKSLSILSCEFYQIYPNW